MGIVGIIVLNYIEKNDNSSQDLLNHRSQIISPASNEIVRNQMLITGTLSSYSDEAYFWLAVQFGNLQWPKVEIGKKELEWSKYINESGQAGNEFAIVLLKVNEDGQRVINNWFERGDDNGHYPGFEIIPDSETLDLVHVTLEN